VGRPIDDIRLNVDVTDLGAAVAEVIDTNSMKEREVQDRGGAWHRLRIRPYKTVDNKIDGAVLSLTDIDALKRSASTAALARDYFAAIVEAVQIPLVAVDAEMQVMSANQAFEKVFRVSAAELEGRGFFQLCARAFDAPGLRAALADTMGKADGFRGLEIEAEVADRGRVSLSVSARPAPSPKGAPMMVVAIEDVSEARRAERERARLLREAEEAKAEAEGANAAKDLFLAVLSHELRTPLSTILLQAQRLNRGDLAEDSGKRAGAAIERAIKTQAQLIDDLLDVSRIASGKLKMELQDLEMGSVVATALDAVESLAAKKSITIETVIPADESVGTVSGDPLRMRQVVWNLVSNAIKYTPEGGHINVTLDATDGHARIRVHDNGRGIDSALLPHVFERFVQAAGVSTRAQGLGLGLTIVKNVVEAHGGTVQAESPGLGKGATFTVLLPVKSRESAEAKPGGAPRGEGGRDAQSELRGVRILIVDDDPDSRDTTADMLGERGAVVWKASSAAEARGVLPGFRPQVLVSDIAMPDEDGLSLIQGIRGDGSAVPALALSGLTSAEDCQRALSAGFDAHLPKPVGAERLADAVARLAGLGATSSLPPPPPA
jgi:two-component system CheB/CheR fusion protein